MSMSTNTHRQFKNVLHVYSCTDTGFNNLTWNKCVKLDYKYDYFIYYVLCNRWAICICKHAESGYSIDQIHVLNIYKWCSVLYCL